MKIATTILAAGLILLLTACSKTGPESSNDPSPIYFPPLSGNAWETVTPASLGWNETELANLYPFLQQKGTRGFIILKNGRMVVEKYFGGFTMDSLWYWASAGKTVTAFLVGIAQAEGKLNIGNRTSQYLGVGWTSAPRAKENQITVRHQLTMTSGLDDGVPESACTETACLQYLSDAGTRWAYHNAPYTLLNKVVEAATGVSYNQWYQQKLRDRTGMNGLWIQRNWDNVLWSTPRSAARFGLLLLNKGKWDATTILSDTAYIQAQTNSTQTLNPSYGYLTWLNGKASYMLPQSQYTFNGALVSNAPADMYCALGKDDQKVYVIPSMSLVVVRMGNDAGNLQLAPSSFDNELWGRLRMAMKY